MRKISETIYDKWVEMIPCDYIHGVTQGSQIDCIALCHCHAPKKRWQVVETVNDCIDVDNKVSFAVAVKSLSLLPRVIRVWGESEPDMLNFHCRPADNNKFDLECGIGSCSDTNQPIMGEVHVDISGDGSEPEENVTISANIDVIRGHDKDHTVRDASVKLRFT